MYPSLLINLSVYLYLERSKRFCVLFAQGAVFLQRTDEDQTLIAQSSDKSTVPKRGAETSSRDRSHEPYRSPWLSSDADSEDSSGGERNPSRDRRRHKHKKHHSRRKTSSRHTPSKVAHVSAVRAREKKRRPSPPHVVLKLRRVASSPHPTTKGTASTGRHNKEYVVIHGNKFKTHKVGHGDTGSFKRQFSTMGSDESYRKVSKDNRRRISYEQYKANLKRSASHKSRVGARATFAPFATAHTSNVSGETEKSYTFDSQILKARPLSQSEEQRLAEVTARIRARTGAICPLTAEYSLKKMHIPARRPTSSQVERVRAKNKIASKDSTGGETTKPADSVMSCDTEAGDARRHGNGIKRADIHGQQLTSQRKPLVSPPISLTSPTKPLTSPPTPVQNASDNNQQQVETAKDEPTSRQHSIWSSDSESESSDDECWCMECFKSRIMGWHVPHVDKFAAMKQAGENQTITSVPAVVTATADVQESAETAVATSALSEIPKPEESHAGTTTASTITVKDVSAVTETTSAETRSQNSIETPMTAVLPISATSTTMMQPMSPLAPKDHITLEEALATLVTAESEGSPKTAEEESTKIKTPSHEFSQVNRKSAKSSSSPSQEEWFKIFLDEAFVDFRPVSPTGSIHSSLFGSSKSSEENQTDFSLDTTTRPGQKKAHVSESTQGSASSYSSSRPSNDNNVRSHKTRTVSKKRAQSSPDTSSDKSARGSTSGTTASLSVLSIKGRDDGINGSKKRARSKSDTNSSKDGQDIGNTCSDTSSSSLSINKSHRAGKMIAHRKRARSSSETSSTKSGQSSTNTSTRKTLLSVGKKSRRGDKMNGSKKRTGRISNTSSGKSARGTTSASASLSHLPDNNKTHYCGKKKRVRPDPDHASVEKSTRTKSSGQRPLVSMYFSCEPIDFFAPDEKRDDSDDGYETPWNFGVTPNLSLSRLDDGLWHSSKPVRSLSRPPPLPPPLYHPRPPGLEHIKDSPPPTSPGSPRHPSYPLRYGATGRSKPAHYYMAPYHRVGVLEHIGSPLQSTSTCPDHMVARYQNYLWIEPYDWEGTDMCDMFDATE
uniref:Uncharacterized protein n=1 Tax=Branchiostoma floridae TaxID=7739 RepID=C3YKE0_BRAFL|eukprot:XP_002603173.1 hypothetical protein BRAFLDRAFT_93432 [Branchiostoma floridae]